jgi:hypothetical protein
MARARPTGCVLATPPRTLVRAAFISGERCFINAEEKDGPALWWPHRLENGGRG